VAHYCDPKCKVYIVLKIIANIYGFCLERAMGMGYGGPTGYGMQIPTHPAGRWLELWVKRGYGLLEVWVKNSLTVWVSMLE
jgi:hypothetical protein